MVNLLFIASFSCPDSLFGKIEPLSSLHFGISRAIHRQIFCEYSPIYFILAAQKPVTYL
jgi:hypothetical protein